MIFQLYHFRFLLKGLVGLAMEEQRNVQLHRDVVVYHILPHVLAEHTQRAGLGTALSNVLICRAAVTASRSLAFWLPWCATTDPFFVPRFFSTRAGL